MSWIGAVALVGGLVGLCRAWRRQAVDAGGCAVALGLACWQYPRLVPYVQALWPGLSGTETGGLAGRQVALVYLFAVLYGLARVLIPLYVPDDRRTGDRRWVAGLIGAVQAGTLAVLAVVFLPRA